MSQGQMLSKFNHNTRAPYSLQVRQFLVNSFSVILRTDARTKTHTGTNAIKTIAYPASPLRWRAW